MRIVRTVNGRVVMRASETYRRHKLGIEERLRRTEDRVAVQERKYAYCRFADALDAAGMVTIFTEDGTASYGPHLPVIEGRAALQAFYARALADVVSSSHHLSNVELDFLGPDRARLRCYLYSWQRFAGKGVPDRHRWARYVDTWVRTPTGWRLAELVYVVAGEIGPDPQPRIGEHLGHPALIDPPADQV